MKNNWITKEDIRNAPKGTIYVYGGNLLHKGHGGQAGVTRDMENTFEIPTKRAPGTRKGDYFSDRDDEIDAVLKSFSKLYDMRNEGKRIVFFPKIGEGRAELPKRSPFIFGMISEFVETFHER